MPSFFATCPRGIEKVLEKELHSIGVEKTKIGTAGVGFECNWGKVYEANLRLTTPSRILYPILDFPAYDPEQIYQNVFKKHDFTKYITTDQTIAVDSSCRDSAVRDIRIIALKTKDAIVDQFRNKYDVRPNVDTEDPDLQISVRLVDNMCTVSLDTSGGSLHYRGYRDRGAPAPLKENLAAALIKITKWNKESPLIDPMCGSGTIVIEAALMGLKIPPMSFRKKFGFQRWLNFQKDIYDKVVTEVGNETLSDVPFRIYGSDKNMRAVAATRANAENAGVEVATVIRRQDFAELIPPTSGPPGILITNPPYGERVGAGGPRARDNYRGGRQTPDEQNDQPNDLIQLYEDLGRYFTKYYSNGWGCWVILSDQEHLDALIRGVGKKPTEMHRVFNGPIECRFVGFEFGRKKEDPKKDPRSATESVQEPFENSKNDPSESDSDE